MFDLKTIKITPLLDTLRLEKISDEIYFSEKYSGYVSNSRLGLINPRQEGSPEKFCAGLKDMGYAPALEIGSAVHELILQPDFFELVEDIGKPTAKMGAMADKLYPIYFEREVTKKDIIAASNKIDYYKGKITDTIVEDVIKSCTPYWESRKALELDMESNKEKIFLDRKSREVVISCVEALQQNNQVMELLHPSGLIENPISENEQAILLDVKAECPKASEKNAILLFTIIVPKIAKIGEIKIMAITIKLTFFIKYKIDPNIVPKHTAISDIINVILAPSKNTGKYLGRKLKSN